MKILGRILLFVVGGFLLYLSITSIISSYKIIQETGWDNLFNAEGAQVILNILVQAFYALGGLYSIFLGLRGKATFISFVVSVILIAIVVYRTYQFARSDTPKNFETIFNLVLTYLMPIGFSLGVILLTVQSNKQAAQ